ncbi:ABC transporter G family member 20 [Caerostris extrusa]|uniref:ABC transporter G family member 20 n=1 Tax=Caerostris extrusa TaxID=172846 RepID=A0AAV4S1W5_CAEEX|nr:ABC transporter G family member 20 [Caerostris extrusa]
MENGGERPKHSVLAVDGTGVCFRFGGKKSQPVLNGLDISVERGIIYGLLGPSGCGKTTLLRCIVGRHKPNSGTITIFGSVPGQKNCSVPGSGVGFMPQELALYPEITTEETLTYFGRLYQMEPRAIKDRISFLTSFLDIPDKKKQIKHLSGGQQRRVSFSPPLIHKPPLLILDEPRVGIWKAIAKAHNCRCRHVIITSLPLRREEALAKAHVVSSSSFLLTNSLQQPVYTEMVMINLACSGMPFHSDQKVEEFWFWEEPLWVKRRPSPTKHDSVTSLNSEGHETILLNDTAEVKIDISQTSSYGSSLKSTANRMGALINKNFVRLKRNIPLVFFQIFVPVFQVIVFCLCVGGEPFDIPMAVVNQETDIMGKSTAFLQSISSHTIRQNNFTDFNLAVDSVKRGENWGVIYIHSRFTTSMMDRYLEGLMASNETIYNSTIRMYLDMTNQQITATIYTTIMDGFLKFSRETLSQFNWNPEMASPPVLLEEPIYGEIDPNFTEFMAPGMILGITYIMAVGLSSMSVIIEKKEGLLDRSWIAGVRSWEVMFSILFTLFIVMLVQVALVLVFTFQAFSIPYRGPLVWVIISVLLVGLEGMAYGLFISSIVNDENIAMMIAMGSFYPNLLLSGIIWPVEAMPYYLRQFSYCLPLTLMANTMRSVLSRGWTITDNNIWDGYLVALAWILPVILISSFFFKYKK